MRKIHAPNIRKTTLDRQEAVFYICDKSNYYEKEILFFFHQILQEMGTLVSVPFIFQKSPGL
jgi:hypothetical protein